MPTFESEWKTRKTRIDPQLDAAGWRLGAPAAGPHCTEEHPTPNGPAEVITEVLETTLALAEQQYGHQERLLRDACIAEQAILSYAFRGEILAEATP